MNKSTERVRRHRARLRIEGLDALKIVRKAYTRGCLSSEEIVTLGISKDAQYYVRAHFKQYSPDDIEDAMKAIDELRQATLREFEEAAGLATEVA